MYHLGFLYFRIVLLSTIHKDTRDNSRVFYGLSSHSWGELLIFLSGNLWIAIHPRTLPCRDLFQLLCNIFLLNWDVLLLINSIQFPLNTTWAFGIPIINDWFISDVFPRSLGFLCNLVDNPIFPFFPVPDIAPSILFGVTYFSLTVFLNCYIVSFFQLLQKFFTSTILWKL